MAYIGYVRKLRAILERCQVRSSPLLDRPSSALPLAALLFAGVFVLRLFTEDPGAAVQILYVLPIALLARFGRWAGLGAALAALGLTVLWALSENIAIGVLNLAAQSVVFFLLGGLLGVYSERAHDISAQKRAERAAQESEARFFAAFQDAPIGMSLETPNQAFLMVNRPLCRLTGYSVDGLLARSFQQLTHPEDRQTLLELKECLLRGSKTRSKSELRLLHADGRVIWVAISSSLVRDSDGNPLYFISQIEDISEHKEAEEVLPKLLFMADSDPLTGLFNRGRFQDELDRYIEYASRYNVSGALFLIDLDNFKSVNDTLGHAAGDELLKGVAEVMRERLRSTDIVARIGGDEFVVLLPQIDTQESAQVAHDLRTAVSEHETTIEGQPLQTTASIGVVSVVGDGDTSEDLMRKADSAMYSAKQAGRDQVAFYRLEDEAKRQ